MDNKYKIKFNIFLVLISGIIFNLAYPPFNIYLFAYISLVPLFYVLLNDNKTSNSFLYGALWAISFYGIFLYWLKIFHILALPAVILALSIYYGILLWLGKLLITRFKKLSYLIIPAVWVSIEYIRSIGFLGFPWGLVFQSQWNFTNFIQLSSIFGGWIISYLVILGNFIIAIELFNYINKKKVFVRKIVIYILLIIVSTLWGNFRVNKIEKEIKKAKKLRVSLIQPTIDPNLSFERIKYKVLSELTVLSEESALYKPELIVWPETAILDYVKYYIENKKKLLSYNYFRNRVKYAENVVRLTQDLGVYLFTGVPDFEEKNNTEYDYNGSILISPKGKILDVYRKNHLVPFGEWFPYDIPFIKKILEETFAGNWTPSKRKTVFSLTTKNINTKFSCLICYEGVFGDLTRRFVLKGAEFFINITNDMWSFSNKAEFQHFIADVFRAVENNVPYIRSANSGVTGIIYRNGKVGKIAPLFTQTFLIVEVPIYKNKNFTFYTKFGDFFPKFLLIFVFILLILSVIKNIREKVL